jgi:hypothetical protein
MRSPVLPVLALSLLFVVLAASGPARAADAAYFNDQETASIANVAHVGLLKSVTVTGKGSVDKVVNLGEIQAAAAKDTRDYIPKIRFLDCGGSTAVQDPAGNRTPIDCSTRVEDELNIAFTVWTVGDKHYPIAFYFKATVTMTPVGANATPQLVVGAEKLGYTKSNRVQGMAEEYIKDFLNHFGLQLALAKDGAGPTTN